MAYVVEHSDIAESIEITVNVSYLGEHLDKTELGYVWLYSIGIQNNSPSPVQLYSRHWEVIDERGVINKIASIGIIGEQPIIRSCEKFEYVSGTYLNTSSGVIVGYYEFIDEASNKLFRVKIPPFSLDLPGNKLSIN